MASKITPPDTTQLLAPFLPALPAATISTKPAIGILPLLSPILRQRVTLLSESSTEPWLRLLCYDTAKAPKLVEIAKSGSLEPHPVSGEVEVDWDYDAEIRYRRPDQETLHALVALANLGLAFQLVYCAGDKEGGGDGWRVGEVTVADTPSPFSHFGGVSNIAEADRQFEETRAKKVASQTKSHSSQTLQVHDGAHETDDDDDDYWARYDATPARTPADKRSPAPPSMPTSHAGDYRTASAEDEYFRQYDDVQPAMDNHDPDEAAQQAHLGLGHATTHDSAEAAELNETQGAWTLAELDKTDSSSPRPDDNDERHAALVHPRPASSASSGGSNTVAKLEATAGKQEASEFGVKQHVSRSIRSLYLLSRASGINREEFEHMVHTELDILGMVEDHD
ncbi:Fc.00g063840.m01.CDS01 [Cosmosporella sp. VM-42]